MKILFENVMLCGHPAEERYYVLVEGAYISHIGRECPKGEFDRVIDGRGCLLTAGFVNAHTHAAMTLFRGYGEDLPLDRWLNERIFPAEDRLTAKSVNVATKLAIADMLRGGIVSYANEVKSAVLGVSEDTILKFGAVSSECVAAMAEGVRTITGSDYSVATSGIAGPGGGSESKPVGTVWIGISSQMGTETFRMQFRGDRKRNIERFAANALNLLRLKLLSELNY